MKETLGKTSEPVICGGLLVRSGDMIIGDRDGVAVVERKNRRRAGKSGRHCFERDPCDEPSIRKKQPSRFYQFEKLNAKQ